MRSVVAIAVAAAVGAAVPAAAATFPVGSPNFTATAGAGGTFSGAFNNTGIASGTFSDTFTFTLPTNGLGSGTVTTSVTDLGSVNDLDFTSVTINDIAATITRMSNGAFEVAFINNVPIVAGELNRLVVNGVSRGNGAYGGQATFTPVNSAVPEPATWAMMIMGFGVVGYAMRRRRTAVRFSQAV
ncbi:FxDxF family PEP-CTERM protein [Sphingomonas sp. RHCKR7]|uniref:FxDxF family PEP-CTERM protein n=1 Tax=Sphingomonas folli TaxID=2862497 RepID=UPI001CA4FD30|nr:FxDxF family PEP-CTERM protein [Sphingomonas folli]MBW6527050.1 FxDxF family PEP-CTERM protein [Sphingomonas folli]